VTPRAPLIELNGVTRRFDRHIAVENLSFAIACGEMVALVGRTGAGKSTVLNMIMGTLPPDRGFVRVAGLDPFADFRALGGKLAVGFQTDRLLPWRTALENVELGLQIRRVRKTDRRALAREWLARVKMQSAEDKYPHELSGGMRQRVSLARALAVDPEIILLDESFSQLDHVTSKVLRTDFAELVRSLGKTCLFITHRIDDALEMADLILVLAAPAHVVLEVRPRTELAGGAASAAELQGRIAAAMGGDEEDGPPGELVRTGSTGAR
jgi:NitT/TauT family transport system ATP-binding protein